MSQSDDRFFEDEVRRIARARWPQAQYNGATIIDGKERDGVFETDDVIHYVEATTSRRAEKAREDTKKLFKAMSEQQKTGSMKGAVGWFITREEPTADQRTEVAKHGKQQVKALSFAQFQQALVDVPSYLSLRENHFFGSVMDPETGDFKPAVDYIALDLFDASNGEATELQSLANLLLDGKSFVLLGDYGTGKSMTLRQLFFLLRDNYRKKGCPSFPLYINLREHSGQDDPSELLDRHGRKIGLEKPHTLVSAWRAGFAVPIIDGFDEITTLGVSGTRTRLRETRRRSLEAVRKLIQQTPRGTGYIVAGREHFFNSTEERESALGLRSGTTSLFLGEFTSHQTQRYLANASRSLEIKIPDWLPSRPLLVAYIATHGFLDALNEINNFSDPIDGWSFLLDKTLDRVLEREANISPNLDGPTLRHILERLSTMARSTLDGLGPITQQQIRSAFLQVCISEPDEQANLLLQRLPGLGVYRNEDDSRTFIDAELAEICRARDVMDFIQNPYGCSQDEGWKSAMSTANIFIGQKGISRISRNLKATSSFDAKEIDSAYLVLKRNQSLTTLAGDLAAVCLELPHSLSEITIVDGIFFENYSLILSDANTDFSRLVFRDCLFEHIEVGCESEISCIPSFQGCIFLLLSGRSGKADLPAGKFDYKCTFEGFSDSSKTQSAILESSLTKGEKLVLTVLRKLFIQSLGGRAESALVRGLDLNDRQLVPEVIRLLQQHKLITLYTRGDGNVWIPARKELNRARKILAVPNNCDDSVMREARLIGKD